MTVRRLLCPRLTAQSPRLQTQTPAAVMRLPDGLSCPVETDWGAQLHLELSVYYVLPLIPQPSPFSYPPHLQVQPFWVSAPFSQAATFLNLARATAFANCCPYGNPSVSSDISGVGWRLEGSLSFEWCRGARCREIFKGVIHHTLAWIGLGLRHRNSIYWDASAQCQPLTEQGKRTWQLAYGVWGGALALPVCIHQSWTKKKKRWDEAVLYAMHI